MEFVAHIKEIYICAVHLQAYLIHPEHSKSLLFQGQIVCVCVICVHVLCMCTGAYEYGVCVYVHAFACV